MTTNKPPRIDPDDDPPHLEPEDILWIRQQRRNDAHEAWLRGQIKVLWPWVVSIVGALVAAAMWVRDHVKL